MKSFDLKGTARTEVGKKSTNELRKNNGIPCILYGIEKEAKAFAVTVDAVRKLVYTPDIHFVNLTIDGVECKAVLKDIQFHPVKDTILHMDFLQIVEDKAIVMEVPTVLTGLAAGVKLGGKLQQAIRKIKVKAVYANIPEKLTVDVTELGLGKSIKVGELSFEGLELVTPAQTVVCSVAATRASREAANGKK
ncbi:MAG: 50S ribosomal protein L25/general stress protein Ctc [Bacteroidaceae bacterium]|jgi:large subunit ribosomal protein L25|nr:50S ribosomal protein L25/general stress protein Ctc [Bacteroidaceae bacterium]MBQ2435855.1 50S ribosomal protein L25/general stress protein Ctc [Bacteroidaceae bacterium]